MFQTSLSRLCGGVVWCGAVRRGVLNCGVLWCVMLCYIL
jgi:hypothetical protein